MAKEPPKPRERGTRQVRAVMISLIGSVLLAALLGGTPLMGAIFWVSVLGFLWLSMTRGRSWARWVTVALTTLLTLGNGYQAFLIFGDGSWDWVTNAGVVVVLVWCIFVLALSPEVNAYLAAQRQDEPREPSE